jgi:hypothetical protein
MDWGILLTLQEFEFGTRRGWGEVMLSFDRDFSFPLTGEDSSLKKC